MKLSAILLASLVSIASANHLLGECQFDCDYDSECAPGLLCADAHKPELKAIGLDQRKANCGNVGAWNEEVCFPAGLLGVGSTGGDPHFRTYDGTMYSYHGECDLIMARGRHLASGDLNVDVHVRTEIIAGWSLISNAAVRIGDDTFELVNNGDYYVNGMKNPELSSFLLAGRYGVTKGEIFIDGSAGETEDSEKTPEVIYKIQFEGEEYISLSTFKNMISVKKSVLLADTEGMMGTRGTNGMVGRDGTTIYEDPNQMGAEWQVRDTEPMLFHEVRAPQYPVECKLPAVSGRRLRQIENNRDLATASCSHVPESMREFCMNDVMMTGDKDMAHLYGSVFGHN